MTLVIDNVFEENVIEDIYGSIEYEFSTREIVDWYDSEFGKDYPQDKKFIAIKKESLSRLDIDRLSLSKNILERIEEIAISICNKNNIIFDQVLGVTYVEYSPKYGGSPELSPHLDADSIANFIIDYQLDSNVTWELGIDDCLIDLKNNQAVGIMTTKQYHWRPKRIWKEEDYVKMLFFHISVKNENIKNRFTEEEVTSFFNKYNGGIK